MAMHAFVAKTGLTNKQLVDNIVMAIQTSRQFFEHLESHFPELLPEHGD